jgi:serine/threonine protein kinase
MNVKLIDFGLANRYGNDERLKTYCGSPSYLAPEVVFHRDYKAKAIDVWCLGVTLYTMLEAQLPFF